MSHQAVSPEEKALFIPLMGVYYDAFEMGIKTNELREYGHRFNERTCRLGRRVLLSRGYGKARRMEGTIVSFRKIPARQLRQADQISFEVIYGTLDADAADIGIELDP
ncbi:MAG: hypothetical protein P1V51_19760 [Deltaproteobacteria bacterium]|nr:hypothetical protein [Deltaproteobacteria bacterium]